MRSGKKFFLAIVSVVVFSIALSAWAQSEEDFMREMEERTMYHRNPQDPVQVNTSAVAASRAGNYEVSVTFTRRSITVRGMLHIPTNVAAAASERPVIVFFHGGSGNPNYYRNNVGYMTTRASQKRFVLLSMQNYWGIGEAQHPNMQLSHLLYHSARASAEILEELHSRGIINREHIFATGHSAGGLTAVATAIYRPDLFSGFGANKANFYEADLSEIVTAGGEVYFHRVEQNLPVRSLHDLRGTSTLGGATEAERVKWQTPAMRDYLEVQLGMPLETRDYANEGHNYSEANFDFFWSIVE